MVVLRATKKVLQSLPGSAGESVGISDNALGDWYVKRLVVDRQPLLLLLSGQSLLPILAPARNVRGLPRALPTLVGDRLLRMGIRPAIVKAEVGSMSPVALAPTNNRAIVGYLVDFAKMTAYLLPIGSWDLSTLETVEVQLARTPCSLNKQLIFPDRAAPELLAARWAIAT